MENMRNYWAEVFLDSIPGEDGGEQGPDASELDGSSSRVGSGAASTGPAPQVTEEAPPTGSAAANWQRKGEAKAKCPPPSRQAAPNPAVSRKSKGISDASTSAAVGRQGGAGGASTSKASGSGTTTAARGGQDEEECGVSDQEEPGSDEEEEELGTPLVARIVWEVPTKPADPVSTAGPGGDDLLLGNENRSKPNLPVPPPPKKPSKKAQARQKKRSKKKPTGKELAPFSQQYVRR